MKQRTLRIIFALVAAGAVLWIGMRIAGGWNDTDPGGAAARIGAVLEGIDREAVERVVVERPEGTMVVVRTENGWTANGRLADPAQIDRFWNGVDASSVLDLASANPENHTRLGVTPDSVITVRFTTGTDTTTLLVGKPGTAGYSSFFLRLPGEDEVALARGDLRNRTVIADETWMDKTILRADTARVGTIAVARGDSLYRIERSDSLWTVEGDPADDNAVRNLLRELTNLAGTGFASPEDSIPAGPRRALTLLTAEGDTLAHLDVVGDGTTRYVRIPGDTAVFELGGWRVDRFTPPPASIRREEGGELSPPA